MPRPRKALIGYYGNVKIVKAICPQCERMAFILESKFACCDTPAEDVVPTKMKRECEPPFERRTPSPAEQKIIMESQNFACFWCDRRFGSYFVYKNKDRVVRRVWDHVLPWCFTQDNSAQNFVASCQFCNGMKGAMVFDTVDAVRLYVLGRWEEKKIEKGI